MESTTQVPTAEKPTPGGAAKLIRRVKKATRRKFSAEDKIRIVIEGLRVESTVAELCRKEGISESVYYSWSKEFLDAGKARLAGDTKRNADANEVKGMRHEVEQLKLLAAELSLDNRRLKKSLHGLGEEI